MTIEQKAKRYNEALKRAKKLYEQGTITESLSYVFPELKESENEKIRKEMLQIAKESEDSFYMVMTPNKRERLIAWLEKQGEQNLANSAKICKDEQKVEPKFKNGQWIAWQDKCYKVNYNGCGYELVDQNGLSTSLEYDTVNENARLWGITKDAKDGDVLATSAGAFIYNGNNGGGSCLGSYCGIDTLGRFKTGVKHHWTGKKVYPATKEQRDTLFAKMKEAGYTFDFEKKELKKIVDEEQIKKNLQDNSFRRMFEQKSAWSKEDETKLTTAETFIRNTSLIGNDGIKETTIDWLNGLKNRVQPQPRQEWSEEDDQYIVDTLNLLSFGCSSHSVGEVKDFLKSLKNRYTWKPNDEQMGVIEAVINNRSFQRRHLDSLYEQLKKLKD